ncbi:MAG: hypothetical protein ACR2OE_11665 [Thermomicrobiales bacterium]
MIGPQLILGVTFANAGMVPEISWDAMSADVDATILARVRREMMDAVVGVVI